MPFVSVAGLPGTLESVLSVIHAGAVTSGAEVIDMLKFRDAFIALPSWPAR
jgi:hypothetical protein